MKDRQTIQRIISKYLKKKTNKREEDQLFSFYKHIESQTEDWDETKHGNKKIREYIIWKKIDKTIADKQKIDKTFQFLFRPSMIAAVAIFLAVVLMMNFQNLPEIREPQAIIIRPGSDKATLQLADGRTMYLDSTTSENLSFATGGAIKILEKGILTYTLRNRAPYDEGINTITVPKGGKFKLLLPDGTSVMLNASSSLRFPTNFSGKERRVKLIGEGYFEVTKKLTKAEKVPFIVETDKQIVTVLGTTFNINAYQDEETVKTTLIEGSVKVSPTDQNTSIILKPGEQSILNNENLTFKQVVASQSIAWKQGDFAFDDMPLEEIMRQISRWYDVEVSYEENIGKIKFGGSISRSKDIQEVLDVLKLTGIHFNLKGRRIMVKP